MLEAAAENHKARLFLLFMKYGQKGINHYHVFHDEVCQFNFSKLKREKVLKQAQAI